MSEFLAALSWPFWLGLCLVLILVAVLAYLLWRRLSPHASPDSVLAVPPPPVLPTRRLTRVWHQFTRAIPFALRRSVLGYPLYVVIGEAGSGKTTVIDRCANWQGQSFRFHPSQTDDPLLQIYAGARSLVVELSASLTYDTTPGAYRALRHLWDQLPSVPTAVLVIDARTLMDPQPERLRQSAQALLGKLDTFSDLSGQALKVNLALTHMESVPGFTQFAELFAASGLPLSATEADRAAGIDLAGRLAGLQSHLERALVHSAAPAYLEVVAFLGKLPELVDTLAEYFRLSPSGRRDAPIALTDLCLLAEPDSQRLGELFQASAAATPPPRRPLSPHCKTAAAIALSGCAYFIGSFQYEQSLLRDNVGKLGGIEDIPLERYSDAVSPLFLDWSLSLAKDPLLTFLPNFFPDLDRRNNAALIKKIRSTYLIPKLDELQATADSPFAVGKLLALLYAEPGNAMAELVNANLDDWQNTLDLPRDLIQDYIKYNVDTDQLEPLLDQRFFVRAEQIEHDITPWLVFFNEVEQAARGALLERTTLERFRERAVALNKVIERFEAHRHLDEVVDWLSRHTNFGKRLANAANHGQSVLREPGLRKLVDLLLAHSAEPGAAGATLSQCLERAQAMAQLETPVHGVVEFQLASKRFSVDAAQWAGLINRSRVTWLLREFADRHSRPDGWLFFDAGASFSDLEMNATNEGGSWFAGKARIDGRLTRDAFERFVKPTLILFSETLPKLPMPPAEQQRFAAFVAKHTQAYAERYAASYLNYFRQFQIRIDTPWALQYVLRTSTQPGSPLLQTLLLIRDNTALDLPAAPIFQTLRERLNEFRGVQKMMAEQNGVFPEFGKYQLLLTQLLGELESQQPPAPKPDGDDRAKLKAALSPLGRIALAALFNEEGAYPRLVKTWLTNTGLPEFWQAPFLSPVQRAAELGRGEVEQHVAAIWTDLWASQLGELQRQFPFNPAAGKDAEASPEAITKVLHPRQGAFWLAFKDYFAPLLQYGNGSWTERPEILHTLNLPADLIAKTNAAQHLTSTLWDEQGSAKPLQLLVKTDTLPTFDRTRLPSAPLVALGYLRSGTAAILGFNQEPVWQTFALEWSAAPNATVGLEFKDTSESARTYADITVADSRWSFFRLLELAQPRDQGRQLWTLDHPELPGQNLKLSFQIQNDPRPLFTRLSGI